MSEILPDDLWRDFPRTAPAFEARFKTEDDCRAYWIKARWGGRPACAKCKSERVWSIRKGTTFDCAACGHQTSLTSGTVLEKTRKPFRMWFRAIFEITTRRTGISAKDLQLRAVVKNVGVPHVKHPQKRRRQSDTALPTLRNDGALRDSVR